MLVTCCITRQHLYLDVCTPRYFHLLVVRDKIIMDRLVLSKTEHEHYFSPSEPNNCENCMPPLLLQLYLKCHIIWFLLQ